MDRFRKYVEKFYFSLKYDKNDRYFTEMILYIYCNILLNFSQNDNCFGKQFLVKSKKPF